MLESIQFQLTNSVLITKFYKSILQTHQHKTVYMLLESIWKVLDGVEKLKKSQTVIQKYCTITCPSSTSNPFSYQISRLLECTLVQSTRPVLVEVSCLLLVILPILSLLFEFLQIDLKSIGSVEVLRVYYN